MPGVIIAREAVACVIDQHGNEHTTGSTATIAAGPKLISDVQAAVQATG